LAPKIDQFLKKKKEKKRKRIDQNSESGKLRMPFSLPKWLFCGQITQICQHIGPHGMAPRMYQDSRN
jgi:hypothetical protein